MKKIALAAFLEFAVLFVNYKVKLLILAKLLGNLKSFLFCMYSADYALGVVLAHFPRSRFAVVNHAVAYRSAFLCGKRLTVLLFFVRLLKNFL